MAVPTFPAEGSGCRSEKMMRRVRRRGRRGGFAGHERYPAGPRHRCQARHTGTSRRCCDDRHRRRPRGVSQSRCEVHRRRRRHAGSSSRRGAVQSGVQRRPAVRGRRRAGRLRAHDAERRWLHPLGPKLRQPHSPRHAPSRVPLAGAPAPTPRSATAKPAPPSPAPCSASSTSSSPAASPGTRPSLPAPPARR